METIEFECKNIFEFFVLYFKALSQMWIFWLPFIFLALFAIADAITVHKKRRRKQREMVLKHRKDFYEKHSHLF